ncbi:MAG: prolyl-tRNA synthetase associated domain-containing protein [Alphaproteobacteria bacterium]|nr:prolyl-tRNA synthetase associated domain-containing protein [Alphaproteobacteria bacterium]
MPLSSDELLNRLSALGVAAVTHEHTPLRTVEEAKRLRGNLPGGHVKNLFLRGRQDRYWLFTTFEDTSVDLKELGRILNAGRFSFGSSAALEQMLGILPGAVSPLAAANDTGGAVTVVLDEALLAADLLNVHPLRNDRTTALAPADLVRFLHSCGHPPQLIRLEPKGPSVPRAP